MFQRALGAGDGVGGRAQLLHRRLGAVRDRRQWDLSVQVQEGREGEPGWVDVLELVDDVADGLLHAVELFGILTVRGLKPRGAHSHTAGEEQEEVQTKTRPKSGNQIWNRRDGETLIRLNSTLKLSKVHIYIFFCLSVTCRAEKYLNWYNKLLIFWYNLNY